MIDRSAFRVLDTDRYLSEFDFFEQPFDNHLDWFDNHLACVNHVSDQGSVASRDL